MLAANTVLKKLDLSSNHDGYNSHAVEFAQELAVGIRDNGALSSLNLASNSIGGYFDAYGFYDTPEGNKHAIFVCAASL
jgi:hypothetical protein